MDLGEQHQLKPQLQIISLRSQQVS